MTTMNGSLSARQRKSLADQIDRLDATLDGLAEALNGAVADAVKEAVGVAVKEAVEAVFREVLTNPQVAKTVAVAHGLTAAPAPRKLTLQDRIAGAWRAALIGLMVAKAWVAGAAANTVQAGCGKISAAAAKIASHVRDMRTLAGIAVAVVGLSRRVVLTAGVIGAMVGLGCYIAGPLVASCLAGLTATIASIAVGAMNPLREVFGMAAGQTGTTRASG